MLTTEQLTELSDDLYVYDVVQKGWEQEPNGLEANVNHVLKHVVKDLLNKDFSNPNAVETATAPDSMQYGLRLFRWISEKPGKAQILPGTVQVLDDPGSRVPQIYREAVFGLASVMHDLDHKAEKSHAEDLLKTSISRSAGQLILCAMSQAQEFEFDIDVAFYARLDFLRKRFGIPEPREVTMIGCPVPDCGARVPVGDHAASANHIGKTHPEEVDARLAFMKAGISWEPEG